jgi:hypothetical protein
MAHFMQVDKGIWLPKNELKGPIHFYAKDQMAFPVYLGQQKVLAKTLLFQYSSMSVDGSWVHTSWAYVVMT